MGGAPSGVRSFVVARAGNERAGKVRVRSRGGQLAATPAQQLTKAAALRFQGGRQLTHGPFDHAGLTQPRPGGGPTDQVVDVLVLDVQTHTTVLPSRSKIPLSRVGWFMSCWGGAPGRLIEPLCELLVMDAPVGVFLSGQVRAMCGRMLGSPGRGYQGQILP